jgi:DnaJ-class molecular chaperone
MALDTVRRRTRQGRAEARNVREERLERSTMTPKINEHTCPNCKGTGFPVVKQPVAANRRIYPVQCTACAGKGKITDAN